MSSQCSSITLISWPYPPPLLQSSVCVCVFFSQDSFVIIARWLPEFPMVLFFFMPKGKGLLLFSIIIPKVWWLFWLECVRKCLSDCYTIVSRKPCIWVYILCPWAKHCGKENSLKPVRAHFWIGVKINPKPTIGLLWKVK